jgi:PhzF family phenazine biosynthesis protein
MARAFRQVDVFTSTPYLGNPVAVVLDAGGLDDADMARFARWTNLSETTFVLPPTDPGADYQVRIFTPGGELPFAGHPTLGTCHAWLGYDGPGAAGAAHTGDLVVQQCAVGLIPVRRAADRLAFAAPPLVREGPVDEATTTELAAILGVDRAAVVDAEWVDNGPGWVGVVLESAEAVLALPQGLAGPIADYKIGVVGPYPPGPADEPAFEVRAFFPAAGDLPAEDPVTGSLNASLAQWLLRTGRASAPYIASQGTALQREGRVHIDRDADGTIWVGGGTVTCIAGEVGWSG